MKWHDRIFSCFVICLLLFPIDTLISAKSGTRIIKGEDVKLLSEPHAEANVIATLGKGQEVVLLKIEKQWVEVQTMEGRQGWVRRKFLGSKPSKPIGKLVIYKKKQAAGVSLQVVTVHLQSGSLRLLPVSAKGTTYDTGTYADESFVSMAKRVGAVAAINGCYFDKHTKKPIGDVAIREKRLHNGGGWAYFGIRDDLSYRWGKDNPVQSRVDWLGFQMGITCLPLLIQNGTVLIRTKEDVKNAGFRDPHIFLRMPRSAIAETIDGKLLFVASGNTTMPSFAKALKAIGVVNALGLDGGASTALYYKGSTKHAPGRKLTTLLAVVKGSYKSLTTETENPSLEKPSTSKPTPPTSTKPKPTSDICQYIEQQPLVCGACKTIIHTLHKQEKGEIASCYEKLCAKCP